jgi:hypothetical protein
MLLLPECPELFTKLAVHRLYFDLPYFGKCKNNYSHRKVDLTAGQVIGAPENR